MPPRVLFQPATPYRASDHDPVLVGLFPIADLAVTKTDIQDPVNAGTNLTYTDHGHQHRSGRRDDRLLERHPARPGRPSSPWRPGRLELHHAGGRRRRHRRLLQPLVRGRRRRLHATVAVAPSSTAGTVLSNTATAISTNGDPDPTNNSATATTTVAAAADLSVTKVGNPDPVTAGGNLTYTLTATNAGPSNAATATLSDTLPAGTTFIALVTPAGWSCTSPPVGSGGAVACSNGTFAVGSSVFTLTVQVAPATAAGTVISNTATAGSPTSDPNPGDESATANTTVAAAADLSVTKVATPDPVTAGGNLTYTLTATNAGPSDAATAALADTLPAGTTFVSLVSPAGWSCTFPPVGSGGTVNCSNGAFAVGNAVFTLVVQVAPATVSGAVITNTVAASAATTDPDPANNVVQRRRPSRPRRTFRSPRSMARIPSRQVRTSSIR